MGTYKTQVHRFVDANRELLDENMMNQLDLIINGNEWAGRWNCSSRWHSLTGKMSIESHREWDEFQTTKIVEVGCKGLVERGFTHDLASKLATACSNTLVHLKQLRKNQAV